MANRQLSLAPSGQLSLSPADQERIRIAQAMQQRGMSGQNRTPLEAIGNTLMNIRGQQKQEAVAEEQAKRRDAYARTMRNVATAGSEGTVTGPGGGGTGEVATAKQRMIDYLSANPDTAPTAAQLQLSQALQPEQARTQTISGEQANQMFGTQLAPGSAVTIEMGPQGRRITGVQEGRQPDQPDYDATNVVLPNGDVRRGRKTESGGLQVVGDQGQWVDAPRDAYMTGMNVSGSRSDVIDATKPEVRDFRKLEAQMPVVKRLKDRIEEGLGSGSYVGGISGSTLKGLNSLRNQAQQVYRQFNQNRPEGERDIDLSVDKFRPALGEVSNMNSKVQSAILSLAYMTLKSRDPSGRVSDNDIRLELDSFGVDTSDPSIIMNRVNEKIGDLFTSYRATAEGLGMEPEFRFNPSEAPDSPESGGRPQNTPESKGVQDSNDPLGIR